MYSARLVGGGLEVHLPFCGNCGCFIYIYIYICVCVCVCVSLVPSLYILRKPIKIKECDRRFITLKQSTICKTYFLDSNANFFYLFRPRV